MNKENKAVNLGIILLGSLAVVIQLSILVYVVDMVLWITQ